MQIDNFSLPYSRLIIARKALILEQGWQAKTFRDVYERTTMTQKKSDDGASSFVPTRAPSQGYKPQTLADLKRSQPSQPQQQAKPEKKDSPQPAKEIDYAKVRQVFEALAQKYESNTEPILGPNTRNFSEGIWKVATVQEIFTPDWHLTPFVLRQYGMPANRKAFYALVEGKSFGNNYKDFTVEMFGVLKGRLPDDYDSSTVIGDYLIDGPEQARRLWQIWMRRVKHKKTSAYIEQLWTVRNNWITSIKGIETDLLHLSPDKIPGKVKLLSKGFLLLQIEKMQTSKPVGHPKDVGWFSNKTDFEIALKEVLSGFTQTPKQVKLLERLDEHPLCRHPKETRTQSDTDLLRDWLDRAALRLPEEAPKDALTRLWLEYKTAE
jgi:hypothetical protein